MAKFKVFLHQYVEEVAVMEIEAADATSARDMALNRAPEADWTAGDDSYSPEVYLVTDQNNECVWEPY